MLLHCQSHALTGRLRLRDGTSAPIVRLSEQQPVDCARKSCKGSASPVAWYEFETNGAYSDWKYPYGGVVSKYQFPVEEYELSH